MLDRAEVLLAELQRVYTKDLEAHEVSAEALNVTHEVIEKCSNVLDQAMTWAYETQIKPKLVTLPKKGGYFPTATNEQSYRSALGQWNATDLENLAPDLDKRLRSLQPFSDQSNSIFARTRELANKKHTGLAPQVRTEQRRVNVTRQEHGSVSWGLGVTFGSGVSMMGAQIDPHTQLPVPTVGVNVAIEKWVSFHFVEGGEDALTFCRAAVEAARRAVQTLFTD